MLLKQTVYQLAMIINMECGPHSPVSIVQIPHLIKALAYTVAWAREGEVAKRKLQHTIRACPALGLCYNGVIQISQFKLSRHHDELTRLEVQQGHRAQRRKRQIVKEPDQAKTHLQRRKIKDIYIDINKLLYSQHYSQASRHVSPLNQYLYACDEQDMVRQHSKRCKMITVLSAGIYYLCLNTYLHFCNHNHVQAAIWVIWIFDKSARNNKYMSGYCTLSQWRSWTL